MKGENMLEELHLLDQLVSSAGSIWIYGAGQMGRCVHHYLEAKEIVCRGFLVTGKPEASRVQGMRVWGLSEAYDDLIRERATILIAVKGAVKEEITDKLRELEVPKGVLLSDHLLNEILQIYYGQIAAERESTKKKRTDSRLQVGYLEQGEFGSAYPEKRLIIQKCKDIEYCVIPKEVELTKRDDAMQEWRAMEGLYIPRYYHPCVDIIHTMNTVCHTDLPWCASFETCVPVAYDDRYYDRLAELIEKDNCLQLFPLCKNAKDIQASMLKEKLGEKRAANILKKTSVLHPPQKVLLDEEEIKRMEAGGTYARSGKMTFLFIGRGVFMKGGKEMLEVLIRWHGEIDFRLIIISNLKYNDYFTAAPKKEKEECLGLIAENPWIEHYESLPNEEVLLKCKEADIGIFPSYGDTYGYACLEMQAAGVPVITSNIRAFPEINDKNCGWICNLPVNDLGYCRKDMGMDFLRETLIAELNRCLEDIFENPEALQRKRICALDRIKRMHDPEQYGQTLMRLYQSVRT